MPKRGKKTTTKSRKIEDKLVENMIELQRLNVKMVEKFESLNSQISALLELFESAAKSFATTPGTEMTIKDKEFLEKVDRLLDQNKTLAKGLTLMEQRLRGRVYGQSNEEMQNSFGLNKSEPQF